MTPSAASSASWLLGSSVAFSLAAVVADPVASVMVSALGLLAIFAANWWGRFSVSAEIPLTVGLALILMLLLANTQIMGRFSVVGGGHAIYQIMAWTTVGALVASSFWPLRSLVTALALSTLVVSSLMVLVPNWMPELSSDVYRAHLAAGQAMLQGENPYSAAVTFESGDPNKPDGTLIEGYPYPPPALLSYGVASMVTDPRIVSLLSWVAFAAALAWFARHRDLGGKVATAALVVVAITPIWRMTLFMAWTEPLSVMLFGLSFIAIMKSRTWGWFVLGVALASKQYLVFLLPLLLMYRDNAGRRPGWRALASAALVAGFPLLFGPADYLRSIVGNALDIGFRPDTQSLNGLIAAMGGTFIVPMSLAIGTVGLVVLTFWKLKVNGPHLVGAAVAVLATAFLGTSAFPNYWLLLMGLASLAAMMVSLTDSQREPTRMLAVTAPP